MCLIFNFFGGSPVLQHVGSLFPSPGIEAVPYAVEA